MEGKPGQWRDSDVRESGQKEVIPQLLFTVFTQGRSTAENSPPGLRTIGSLLKFGNTVMGAVESRKQRKTAIT